MSIFSINDIDYYFLEHCSVDMLAKLSMINKYYHSVTSPKLSPYRNCFNKTHFHINEPITNLKYINACYYGDIDVYKYIQRKYNITYDDMIIGFQFACMRNNLNIAMSITACAYSKFHVIKMMTSNDYYAFRWACKNHCFETAFWVNKFVNIPIDIKQNMLKLFQNAEKLEIQHLSPDVINSLSINIDWTPILLDQILYQKYNVAEYISKNLSINLESINCTNIFLEQIAHQKYSVAEYIGKKLPIDLKRIYKKLLRYIDIDVDINDLIDIAIDKIISGCINSEYKQLIYEDIMLGKIYPIE